MYAPNPDLSGLQAGISSSALDTCTWASCQLHGSQAGFITFSKHIPSQRLQVSVHPLGPQAEGRSSHNQQKPVTTLRNKGAQMVIQEMDLNYDPGGDEGKCSRLRR